MFEFVKSSWSWFGKLVLNPITLWGFAGAFVFLPLSSAKAHEVDPDATIIDTVKEFYRPAIENPEYIPQGIAFEAATKLTTDPASLLEPSAVFD